MAKVTPNIIKSHTFDSTTISIESLGPLFIVRNYERHEGSSIEYFDNIEEAVDNYGKSIKEAAEIEVRLERNDMYEEIVYTLPLAS